MKNWFSQLFAQATEQGHNAIRLALVFIVAASLAVLIFGYVALQSGVWQAYAVVAAFIGFFIGEVLVVRFARQNRADLAGVLLVGCVCYIVLAMTALMGGIGLGLSIALALVIVEIVFETLTGSLATRTRISGFAFAIGIFFLDRLASWDRPFFPAVQYAIPLIAGGTVATIAFLMLGRLVTWRNLSLARKLLISFSALSIFTLIVGIVSYTGLNNVRGFFEESIEEGVALETNSLHLSNSLLAARKYEKDFLARWKAEGFETAHANYILPHKNSVVEVQEHLRILAGFGQIVEGDLGTAYTRAKFDADMALLQEDMNVYERNFQTTVRLLQEKGFKDTGLEGEFRTAVHEIENEIYGRPGFDSLVITMLQIRRHEKDYLLRGDQNYIDQVHQSVIELKKQIIASGLITSAEKSNLDLLADKYVTAFDTLLEKDIEIAVSTQAFQDAALRMEPLVEQLASTGAEVRATDLERAAVSVSQALLFTVLTILIALLVAMSLSLGLSRQITEPVSVLTATANELETGNYDVQAEVSSADEFGMLANAFNAMARQIKQTLATVAQRAAELQTVSEVSAFASTLQDVDNLLWNVSNLTKQQFGLYHAHIYLLNEAEDTLVLAAGAGDAGQKMVAETRSISLDSEQSLVARAARERRGIIVNDVRSAPDFLPHPLLPDTRSELAVPMIVSDKVIGVFDVQSDVSGRFTKENVDIQTIMASQIAIAVQNARSYADVQAKAEREALIASIGQKIQNTSTVESALQVAIREVGRAVGQETFVRLYARQNEK